MGSAATDSELAEQYAPVLYFEADETCYPVDVSYHVDNSYLYQIVDDSAQLVTENPSEADLSSYKSDDYYLDNQQGTVDDLGIIADYQSKLSTLGYTVYARVVSDGGYTIIQYWMFYAFNKGELNQHEGDWEMVQIALSGSTPEQVMYSQHYSGQQTTWDQVERTDDHTHVYVARGSHANYFRYYSGKLGIANDYVGSNGRFLRASDYTLEMLDSQPWLDFAGHWGWAGEDEAQANESMFMGQIGPQGPMYRAEGGYSMWDDPLSWGASLGQLDSNFLLIELLLYHFVTIFLLITLLAFVIAVYRIYRRHKTTGLGPRIVSMLYIDGVNLKSIGNILCFVGIVIAIFGLMNQWYSVSYGLTGTSVVEGYATTSMVDIFNIDGINGIQITVPGSSGPVPMGSFSLPFSLIMGVGFLFLVIASVGLIESKKLGKKYIWRGIKLLIPVIIIIVVIMFIGNIISGSMAGMGDEASDIGSIFDFTSSPLGGQRSIPTSQASGTLTLQWGLGLGGQLLLLSGIVFIVAGILELSAKTTFFEPKMMEPPKEKKLKKRAKSKEPEEQPAETTTPEPILSEGNSNQGEGTK